MNLFLRKSFSDTILLTAIDATVKMPCHLSDESGMYGVCIHTTAFLIANQVSGK